MSDASSAQISTTFVRALSEAVEAAGVPLELFTAQVGIAPQHLRDPYGWIALTEFDRLIAGAVEITGDPAFGLHWILRSPMMKFDLLALATAQAPSLRAALECLQRFQPLLFREPELHVELRGSTLTLRATPQATSELALRVRSEVALCSLVRLVRHVGAPDSAVRRVTFAYGPPSYAREYERLFSGGAHFGCQSSEIEVDASWLDRSLPHANLELHQLLARQAQQVMERAGVASGYAGQVREHLKRVFPRVPEMRELARALALSERSLRRRLQEEGASYSTLLQETRKLLARELVADPTRSITQIGREVGFTSGAAFHRAFKRWTGETPGMFREGGRAGRVAARERAGS